MRRPRATPLEVGGGLRSGGNDEPHKKPPHEGRGFWTLLCFILSAAAMVYATPVPSGRLHVPAELPDGPLFTEEQMAYPPELLDKKRVHENVPPELDVKPRARTIAWAVTVSKDGAFVDGAAVLMRAIQLAHPPSGPSASAYAHAFVAICHPEAPRSRAALLALGWRVLEAHEPVKLDEIQGDFLRGHVASSGCCGARELLKLYAWALAGYWRVVHLDMDSLVLGNMDELFSIDASLVYTCDYNMMGQGSREKLHLQQQQQQQQHLSSPSAGPAGEVAAGGGTASGGTASGGAVRACPVQGGFAVVRPSAAVFQEMVEIVRRGDFKQSGWGGTTIGGWWGGATFQGLVPYYYAMAARAGSLADGPAVEVDRCVYNNMVDKGVVSPLPAVGAAECRQTKLAEIKNAHFTLCQKPWECSPARQKNDLAGLCVALHEKWHEIRADLEANLGLPAPPGGSANGRETKVRFLGHCRPVSQGGRLEYAPLALDSLAPQKYRGDKHEAVGLLPAPQKAAPQKAPRASGKAAGLLGAGPGAGPGEERGNGQEADGLLLREARAAPVLAPPEAPRRKIAWAITVTFDGPFADGAVVLQESIQRTHPAAPAGAAAGAVYEHEFVALVHPNATAKSGRLLRRLGWRVVVAPLPVEAHEIQTAFFRKHAPKSGCCGLAELIKLYAWTLDGYWRVVHLDMDSLVLGNMDELFSIDASLVYTCDYNMMNKGSRARNPRAVCPVQGGFVVVRPDRVPFQGMLDLVREGRFGAGFKPGASGWNGTGIGHWWGGATFQGVVPFWYARLAERLVEPGGREKARVGKEESGRFLSVEVDRCVYDNMVDDPVARPRVGTEACRATPLHQVKNAHFTLCQKPWTCGYPSFPDDKAGLCASLHAKWFELREAAAKRHGLDLGQPAGLSARKYHRGACAGGKYLPMASESKVMGRYIKGGAFVPN